MTRGSLGAGITGGLAGGLAFGLIMQGTAMMSLVARLIGSQSTAVGWLVHLGIAAFLGLLFAVVSGRPQLLIAAVGQGLLWGFLWWILGGLILLPLRLGDDLLVLNSMSWRSLGGHLAYGAVLGVVYGIWAKGLHPGGQAISGPVDTVRGPHAIDPSTQLPPPDQRI